MEPERKIIAPTSNTIRLLNMSPRPVLMGAVLELASRLVVDYLQTQGESVETVTSERIARAIEVITSFALRDAMKQLHPELAAEFAAIESMVREEPSANPEDTATPEQRKAAEEAARDALAKAAGIVKGNGTKH